MCARCVFVMRIVKVYYWQMCVFHALYLGWCSLLLLCGMYVYSGLLVLASVLLVGVW